MGYYEHEFIESLVNKLDGCYEKFYKMHNKIFEEETFFELVDNVMDEFYKGETDSDKISAIITSVKSNRRMIRNRWYSSFTNDSLLDINCKDNPNNWIVISLKNLSPDKFYEEYGNISIDEAIEMVVKEQREKIEEWIGNKNSKFIEFPIINSKKNKDIVKTLKIDIIVAIDAYIQKELHGVLGSYKRRYPEDIINLPVFGGKKYKQQTVPLPESSEVQEDITDENGNTLLSVITPDTTTSLEKINTLDIFDIDIINAIINIALTQSSFSETRAVIVTTNKLFNMVKKRNPTSEERDLFEARVSALGKSTYKYSRDSDVGTFNFISDVSVSESHVIKAYPGIMIYDAIIQNKLVGIVADSIDKLQTNLAKVLAYWLKSLQISHQAGDRKYTISYNMVLANGRFPGKNRKENLSYISEAFKDFKENELIISDFTQAGDRFEITFLPLTTYEKEDLAAQEKRTFLLN